MIGNKVSFKFESCDKTIHGIVVSNTLDADQKILYNISYFDAGTWHYIWAPASRLVVQEVATYTPSIEEGDLVIADGEIGRVFSVEGPKVQPYYVGFSDGTVATYSSKEIEKVVEV